MHNSISVILGFVNLNFWILGVQLRFHNILKFLLTPNIKLNVSSYRDKFKRKPRLNFPKPKCFNVGGSWFLPKCMQKRLHGKRGLHYLARNFNLNKKIFLTKNKISAKIIKPYFGKNSPEKKWQP